MHFLLIDKKYFKDKASFGASTLKRDFLHPRKLKFLMT